MPTSTEEILAHSIAKTIYSGFEKHYKIFSELTIQGKKYFEEGDIRAEQQAIRERIAYYDERVYENIALLNASFADKLNNLNIWENVKLFYLDILINSLQPELAETFFNSVVCRILHRDYFHNKYIFRRPLISLEYLQGSQPTYQNYYPQSLSLRNIIKKILISQNWSTPFINISQDIAKVLFVINKHFVQNYGKIPRLEANSHIQVLHSPFYQNVAAYIIGKFINGNNQYPFALVIRRNGPLENINEKTQPSGLYIDALILDATQIEHMFSLSRAYFLVNMQVPSAYIKFLRSIMPNKPKAEIYTMIGLGKQGKTDFYRDLIYHLNNSQDKFIIAPGIPGMVMVVFMLPSFPFVFKIIRDKFGSTKNVDHPTVKKKYTLVKQVDRVGRMADTLEYSDVALPIERFTPELLQHLKEAIPSLLEIENNTILIRHLYIERRMRPLNMYITQQQEDNNDEALNKAVIDYGNAIRELAQANIFPGDMLWKNFGVARFERVVFYDYDEIEYMTDCNFRDIPPCPHPDMELMSEPWYSVGKNDIFPEEFASFLLGSKKVREIFMKHHKDLLTAKYWKSIQNQINQGKTIEHFPYPQEYRLLNIKKL